MSVMMASSNDPPAKKSVIYEEKLTVNEVAAVLGFSEPTVRRWFRSGYLKGVKYGNKWYILKSDLEAFMEGKQNEKQGGTNDDQNCE